MNKVPQDPIEESFKNCSYPCPKNLLAFTIRLRAENLKVIVILGNVTHVGVVQTYMNFTHANHVFAKSFLRRT